MQQSYQNDGSIDLIQLMTKMTLLIVFAVSISMFCVVVIICLHIYQSIYIYLIEIIDILVTSVMLYLQFEFSINIYFKLCNKCDLCVLSLCFVFVEYQFNKIHTESSEFISNLSIDSIKLSEIEGTGINDKDEHGGADPELTSESQTVDNLYSKQISDKLNKIIEYKIKQIANSKDKLKFNLAQQQHTTMKKISSFSSAGKAPNLDETKT
eukprot:UN06028